MNRLELLGSIYQYADENLPNKEFVPGKSDVPASGVVLYPEDIQEVADALLEFWYTDWRKCLAFRDRLCKVTGKKHCVLVNSGSSASLAAQTALFGSSRDRFVVTTALGFPTTVYPIWQNGKVPIFLDVDSKTLAPSIEEYFSPKNIHRVASVAGYIFAHTLGFPFYEPNVPSMSIIDCCDALGARIKIAGSWVHVGSESKVMTLSFFPAHHITTGEGGAILTDDDELAERIEHIINWGRDCYCLPGQNNTCGHRFEIDKLNIHGLPDGWDHKYTFTDLGYNFKMTEFQAALGYSQLSHLDHFVACRRDNYNLLLGALSQYSCLNFIDTPEWSSPSPFGFPIRVDPKSPVSANKLIQFLEERKIRTRRVFGGNLTRQPFIQNLPYAADFDGLRGTDDVMENMFWIGCWPGLTEQHLYYVVDVFDQFFTRGINR
jgi:CDP-4-dehydro-6-deoxyglucose reductase, E1